MKDFLRLLKDTAVFLLAAQMLMHFLPAKKYEKYGKLMVSLIVLSQLTLPILSIVQKDATGQFWNAFGHLEEENEMFSGKLAALEGTGEDVVRNGIVQSVEQKVETVAARAGVEVADVRLKEDGVVLIEVKRAGARDGGYRSGKEGRDRSRKRRGRSNPGRGSSLKRQYPHGFGKAFCQSAGYAAGGCGGGRA